ncbi:hypothetical protein [Streptomyces sp. NPDC058542]|uniref:hypothetical protein n=1 Tax=Streptomyces sp. NPDC058542 TaxID=3346543 RepID=UPI00366316DA
MGDVIKDRDPDTGKMKTNHTPPLQERLPAWARNQIRPRLTKTLEAIHEEAPYAKIVLMGYPKLLEALDGCVTGINAAEAFWLNEMSTMVATEMGGAVRDTGSYAVFADPRAAFAGQGVCGVPETIHGLVFTGHSQADDPLPQPSMKSFHPKVSGTAHYAKAFQQALTP